MFKTNLTGIAAKVLALVVLSLLFSFSGPKSGKSISPEVALQKLLNGNKRFVESKQTYELASTAAARATLAFSQKPYAIILCCSDSRVPPEIIFDKGLGEIFIIRVAGNVIDPIAIGSIEYAAEHLGSPLIMVLGHERCGAVTAAVESKGKSTGSENIDAIVEKINPCIKIAELECEACDGTKNCAETKKKEFVECVIDVNAKTIAASLTKKSEILNHLQHEGKIKIVAAKYDLDTGIVSLLSDDEHEDGHDKKKGGNDKH